jgi:hypothetical protein
MLLFEIGDANISASAAFVMPIFPAVRISFHSTVISGTARNKNGCKPTPMCQKLRLCGLRFTALSFLAQPEAKTTVYRL